MSTNEKLIPNGHIHNYQNFAPYRCTLCQSTKSQIERKAINKEWIAKIENYLNALRNERAELTKEYNKEPMMNENTHFIHGRLHQIKKDIKLLEELI